MNNRAMLQNRAENLLLVNGRSIFAVRKAKKTASFAYKCVNGLTSYEFKDYS